MDKPRMILKYPGAKWRIAEWIISHMPKHHSYLEPFFGSGAVLFNKPPSKIETVNDIDGEVVNLFRVVRDNHQALIRAVTYTPFSRQIYNEAFFDREPVDDVERARIFLIKCWQGYGFRNIAKHRSGWKNDVQGREAAYSLRNWYRLPQWIELAVERLREVQIEQSPAVDLISRFNYSNVLIYADPPYLLSTRGGKSYNNCIYNDYLKDWRKYSVDNLAEKGQKRIETIWVKD